MKCHCICLYDELRIFDTVRFARRAVSIFLILKPEEITVMNEYRRVADWEKFTSHCNDQLQRRIDFQKLGIGHLQNETRKTILQNCSLDQALSLSINSNLQ